MANTDKLLKVIQCSGELFFLRDYLSVPSICNSFLQKNKKKKSSWRSKTKKPLESLIVPEESCVTCYSLQFAYFCQVCCEALQNQSAPAALAKTALLKAYKGSKREIMCTWGKQSKSVSVALCVIKHWIKLCPIQNLNAETKDIKIGLKAFVYFHIFLCSGGW